MASTGQGAYTNGCVFWGNSGFLFTSVVPCALELTFDCRNDDYSTPLDLLDEDSEEMFDLLDKDRLLPRSSDPDLGEHIIEVSMCVESPLLF